MKYQTLVTIILLRTNTVSLFSSNTLVCRRHASQDITEIHANTTWMRTLPFVWFQSIFELHRI